MSKKKKAKFKPYSMNQGTLLPEYLDDLIPQAHLVRVISGTIDRIDTSSLLSAYRGGGASAYHPEMMLKVLVYAYAERIYSSRRIAKALRENIHFMWLSGKQRPDFHTIARFRSGPLKETITRIFAAAVELLAESGHIKLENYFLDGTKVESAANKYSWVWGKSTHRYHKKLRGQVAALLADIDDAEAEEQRIYGEQDLEELGENAHIDSKMLAEAAERINEQLKERPKDKGLKRAARKIEKDYLPRLKKYEEQRRQLGGRNSYSKTDPDATFMRMKEDHMRNGQLKPGYNVQLGTEGQFVVGYSVHQSATDSPCLKDHIEQLKQDLGKAPERVIADAGYGSEENYEYLAGEGIEGLVKYNKFDREQKKSFKKKDFEPANWSYDEQADEYECPAGKRLVFAEEKRRKTKTGYKTKVKIYRCEDCGDCEFGRDERCRYYNGNLWRSPKYEKHKKKATKLLTSAEGEKLRKRRGVEVETVFGQIKQNMGFRRFMLRGLEKVSTEWGLLSLAHNMCKLATAEIT